MRLSLVQYGRAQRPWKPWWEVYSTGENNHLCFLVTTRKKAACWSGTLFGTLHKKKNYIFWHIIFSSVFTLTPSISISIVCQTKFFGNKYKYQGHSFISFYNTLITSKGQVLDVNIKYMLMEGGWKWNWQCCICVYIHHNPFCCN